MATEIQPKFYTRKDLQAVIKHRRSMIDLAVEERIGLTGTNGSSLNRIMEFSGKVFEGMQVTHGTWIDQKREELSGYLSGLDDSTLLEEMYHIGVHRALKQEFRTSKKVRPEETANLSDPRYLQDVITAYTISFYRSIRISERLGVDPSMALYIAQNVNYNPPSAQVLFRKKYSDLPEYVITMTLASRPTAPDKALERIRADIASYRTQFPDLPENIITRAGVNYTGEGAISYLVEFRKNIIQLVNKFGVLLPMHRLQAIAASYPHNPGAFVENALARISEITEAFPELSWDHVTYVAVSHSISWKKLLLDARSESAHLSAQFPELPQSLILREAIRNPKKARGRLEKNQKRLAFLKAKYPDISMTALSTAAYVYTKNPEGFLQEFQQRLNILNETFPDLKPYVKNRIAILNINIDNIITYTKDFIEKAERLFQQFPNFTHRQIIQAMIGYPTRTENYLKKVEEVISQLRIQYPDILPFAIPVVAFAHPKNAETVIKNARRLISELKQRFPERSMTDLTRAAIKRPLDPDSYLEAGRQTGLDAEEELTSDPD